MIRKLSAILAGIVFTVTASAQEHGQARTVKIWDNATAPHSNGITTPEREPYPNRIYNTSEAVLNYYPADMARWFAANGIAAAVLKYRLPNGDPRVPLEDTEQPNASNRNRPETRGGIIPKNTAFV